MKLQTSEARWHLTLGCRSPGILLIVLSRAHKREVTMEFETCTDLFGATTLQVCPTFYQRDRATNLGILYHMNLLKPEILACLCPVFPPSMSIPRSLPEMNIFFPEPFVVNINISLQSDFGHLQCMNGSGFKTLTPILLI